MARVVDALRVIAPGLPYEIIYTELDEKFHRIRMKGGYILEAFKLRHTVTCYGYSQIIERAGKFDPAKAKEQDIPLMAWSKLQKGETVEMEGRIFTPDMVLGKERKGLKLTYCTDTRPIPEIADLFICEGMYGEDELREKAIEKKHMIFSEAAELAAKAGAAELWLTHYSPSLARPKDYVEKVRNIFPQTYPGKDRKSKTLNFENDREDTGSPEFS